MSMALTVAQVLMLESAAIHGDPMAHLQGRSAHGGATRTIVALRRLGLLGVAGQITDAGRAALNAYYTKAGRQLLPARGE